jgi:hypothetical protein
MRSARLINGTAVEQQVEQQVEQVGAGATDPLAVAPGEGDGLLVCRHPPPAYGASREIVEWLTA